MARSADNDDGEEDGEVGRHRHGEEDAHDRGDAAEELRLALGGRLLLGHGHLLVVLGLRLRADHVEQVAELGLVDGPRLGLVDLRTGARRVAPVSRARCSAALAALLCGCAEGGLQDNPQSEVEIAADHHLFWFRTLPGFGPFPPTATSVLPCRSMFAMAADSTYQLTEISCGSGNASDNYALAENGELTLFVTGSGQFPTIALLGGYSRVVNQPDLFFTDRITLGTSPSIGLLYGTEQEIGSVDLEGAWHLVSLHVMFSGGLATFTLFVPPG